MLFRVDQVFQQVARLALQQEEAEAEQSTAYVIYYIILF